MQIATLDEPERVEKLSAKTIGAAAVVGERGDRAWQAITELPEEWIEAARQAKVPEELASLDAELK